MILWRFHLAGAGRRLAVAVLFFAIGSGQGFSSAVAAADSATVAAGPTPQAIEHSALRSYAVPPQAPAPHHRLVFTSIIHPSPISEQQGVLLAESIRAFGGSLARSPIWFYVPLNGRQPSPAFDERMRALDVTLVPFEMERNQLRFPFAAKVVAAALAEAKAEGTSDFLVLTGTDTIVLKEPQDFLLDHKHQLGTRPVHHINVGSVFERPLDAFWRQTYASCKVPDDRVFPMKTHVDGITARPYFNAGILVVRPQMGLFRAWRDTFFASYLEPAFKELYEKDQKYAIFVHQAILTGVVLARLEKEQIRILPATYNYPLHLWHEDVTEERPSALEELVTFRHEATFADPAWNDKIPAGELLKEWLAEHLLEVPQTAAGH